MLRRLQGETSLNEKRESQNMCLGAEYFNLLLRVKVISISNMNKKLRNKDDCFYGWRSACPDSLKVRFIAKQYFFPGGIMVLNY